MLSSPVSVHFGDENARGCGVRRVPGDSWFYFLKYSNIIRGGGGVIRTSSVCGNIYPTPV